MPAEPVPEQVRTACAWVAERSRFVRIDEAAVQPYALALSKSIAAKPDPETQLVGADRETLAAFVICLDAINFGSGWWPTIAKRPGLSGYGTIAAGVAEHFRGGDTWSVAELAGIVPAAVAGVVGQAPEHPLMTDFARSLRDVGAHVRDDHGGSFAALADAASGSAAKLAGLLASWEAFADTSIYEEHSVPFFKRAQLAAADLDRAGVVAFPDRDRLTAFADNLVPHVLRVDGVLHLDSELERRIEAGELLEHGSPEEVELRACAVHAVELLAASGSHGLAPADIDAELWNRGREPRCKASPRPRSRNTAY